MQRFLINLINFDLLVFISLAFSKCQKTILREIKRNHTLDD